MQTSRREFLGTTIRHATGASLLAGWAAGAEADPPAAGDLTKSFKLVPIGKVEKTGGTTRIRIFDDYADGLLGLDGWSHVNVFYWFDQNDTPKQRRVLRVHPRGDPENPLTGVFACRAPMRPNLIALSVCRILSVQGTLVTVDGLDAFDASPVLDLKPFIPPDAPQQEVRVPAWAKERQAKSAESP